MRQRAWRCHTLAPRNTKNLFVLVFSNKLYILIASSVATAFWVLLNYLDQLLFFWPTLMFYLPGVKLYSFTITNITSVVAGLVVPMNIYLLARSRKVNRSLLPGASFAFVSCACAGCTSIGLSILPTLGSIGAMGLAFFVQYQDLFRLISLGILCWSLFSISRQINSYGCN
jgi:hypothetical protein